MSLLFINRYVSEKNDSVKGTWLWTKVPIYFIYPPSVFQFTSLLFNYHSISNQVQDLMIQLPAVCYNISTINCRNETVMVVHNNYLDVLTNEVSLYYGNNYKRGGK